MVKPETLKLTDTFSPTFRTPSLIGLPSSLTVAAGASVKLCTLSLAMTESVLASRSTAVSSPTP